MGCTLVMLGLVSGSPAQLVWGWVAVAVLQHAGGRAGCAAGTKSSNSSVCFVLQVRVLELENQLQKERQKLGELRKKHYELAGVAEGWEEDGEYPRAGVEHCRRAAALQAVSAALAGKQLWEAGRRAALPTAPAVSEGRAGVSLQLA